MNPELITHVFASLQSLEKCLSTVKKLLPGQEEDYSDIARILPEQERVLQQMRRIANKLQLEVARGDWAGGVRSLKIFYGLNHMIRFDLLHAFSTLSRKEAPETKINAVVSKEVVYH